MLSLMPEEFTPALQTAPQARRLQNPLVKPISLSRSALYLSTPYSTVSYKVSRFQGFDILECDLVLAQRFSRRLSVNSLRQTQARGLCFCLSLVLMAIAPAGRAVAPPFQLCLMTQRCCLPRRRIKARYGRYGLGCDMIRSPSAISTPFVFTI